MATQFVSGLGGWLGDLSRDLRGVMRSLSRTPASTAAVILTFGLGIGGSTAVFSAVYATLLKPLPYPHAEQIYSIEVAVPDRHSQTSRLPLRIQDYLSWRNAQTAFSTMAALRPDEWTLAGDGEPERIPGASVSWNFFEFLGVSPSAGRGFTAEEEKPGADKVVVLSDALWRRRYGADPGIVGRTINLSGESYVVVGVASPSLLVPTGTQLSSVLVFAPRIEIWKPIAPTRAELESESWDTGLLARVRPGESAEQGRQQLESLLNAAIRAQAPDVNITLNTRITSIRELFSGQFRTRLLLVFAASLILLLTACTTVANLLLARFAGRAQEFAIRTAVGAGRGRIVTQLLTESISLALAGAIAGTAAAYVTTGVLAGYEPAAEQLVRASRLDLPALLFATSLALLTGFLCAVIPAWRASRRDVCASLREGSRTVGRMPAKLRTALVALEIALGTALLTSSGLLLHSFVRLAEVDRGYDVDHSLAVDLSLPEQQYATPGQKVMFYRSLAESIGSIHGVEAVGVISDLPAMGVAATRTIFYRNDADFRSVVMRRPVAGVRSVSPGYFRASQATLKAGSVFTELDTTPVAVISESLARGLWPGEPLPGIVGRSIREGDVAGELVTITGVVADAQLAGADRELAPQLYRPNQQRAAGKMSVVVRVAGRPEAVVPSVRAAVRAMAPSLPILAIRPVQEIISTSIAQRRFEMLLTSVFAASALLLGIIGVYGMVVYSVNSQTREIGLRMVFGATRGSVLGWVLIRGLRAVIAGMVVGTCATVIAATSLRSLLFGIGPADPLALGAALLILLVTSVVACYIPARHAAALDPADALRVQ